MRQVRPVRRVTVTLIVLIALCVMRQVRPARRVTVTLHVLIVVCHAAGAPGPPRHCVALNVTDHEARLGCQLGYDGGEPLDFVVDKQSPHDDLERVREASQLPPPHLFRGGLMQ